MPRRAEDEFEAKRGRTGGNVSPWWTCAASYGAFGTSGVIDVWAQLSCMGAARRCRRPARGRRLPTRKARQGVRVKPRLQVLAGPPGQEVIADVGEEELLHLGISESTLL